jgi:hypothetical protein
MVPIQVLGGCPFALERARFSYGGGKVLEQALSSS